MTIDVLNKSTKSLFLYSNFSVMFAQALLFKQRLNCWGDYVTFMNLLLYFGTRGDIPVSAVTVYSKASIKLTALSGTS